MIELRDYQVDAIHKMRNGCILCGGVGSGKSRTSLGYYYKEQGGSFETGLPTWIKPHDLIIITTARKRDTGEWEDELKMFGFSTKPEENQYKNRIIVDSWNNIQKYQDEIACFFIFDEQRVVGSGAWVKAFLEIAKKNRWILLSATPGDTWSDYIPVFIANGFYKNRSEFNQEHVIYSRYSKYPKVDRYINEGRLIRYRSAILVDMDFHRETQSTHMDIQCDWPVAEYRHLIKTRWNPYENEPVRTPAELAFLFRRIVNSDPSRSERLLFYIQHHKKIIVFYNYNYELDILRKTLTEARVDFAEWNGQKHEAIPQSASWAYLVQYTAGCEGWNCVETNAMIFYSQNYSYKVMEQAAGRIDRLNTPFKELYYYHFKSSSPIDNAIQRALVRKKAFNETKFVEKYFQQGFSCYEPAIQDLQIRMDI